MIIKKIEKQIKNKKKNGFIYPQYDGYSLYNVVPTLFNLFGVRHKRETLRKDLFKKYINKNNKIIFFLIDGFGYYQYKKFFSEFKFLDLFSSHGVIFPITSVFPSTTASVLTTLATGLTPQEHGLFEWTMYIEEIDEMIQTLPFAHLGDTQNESLKKEGVSADVLLKDRKTIYQDLKDKGIKSYVFLHQSIVDSTYSSLITKGAERVSYTLLSELLSRLRQCIIENPSPAFFYVYWPDIDSQAHKFGPNSKECTLELKVFFDAIWNDFIQKINRKLRKNLTILLTSDHGQLDVDPDKTIYLSKDKSLLQWFAKSKNNKVILPWGSPRDVFISIKKDKKEEALDYLVSTYGKDAKILMIEDAVSRGLFGINKPSDIFLKRAGDIIILPYENKTIWYEHISGDLFNFYGYHGGLSEEEMLIPFGLIRLGDAL